jgi:hypothetical protein
MSLLATVVSEGSPGSSLWMGPSPLTVEALSELLRARFDEGAFSVFFDLLGVALAGPVESPSSPDASREDGWSSVPEGTGRWEVLRLRLPGGEEGDMMDDGKEWERKSE